MSLQKSDSKIFRTTPYKLQFLFAGALFRWIEAITIPGSSTLNIQILIIKGRTTHVLSRSMMTSAPLISITLNENATFNPGTTISTISNSNLPSNRTSQVTIYTDSTLTVAGTIIENLALIPDLEWNQVEPELILASGDISYAIRITNGSLTPQIVDFNWAWYESDDKNVTLGPAPSGINIVAANLSPTQIYVAPKTYYAYKFSGIIGDYIRIPRSISIEPTAQITIEFRFRFDGSTIPEGQGQRMVHKWSDTNNTGYEFFVTTSVAPAANHLRSRLSIDGILQEQDYDFTPFLGLSTIHHLATTYDGANVKFYFDGNSAAPDIPVIGTITHNSMDLYFGIYENGGPVSLPFKGMIDEVRIWSIARTQVEIQTNMLGSVDPTSSNLVGYWKLDEISGATAFNALNNGTNDGAINGTVREVISYHPEPVILNLTLPTPTIINV